jgi:hypothetical protein
MTVRKIYVKKKQFLLVLFFALLAVTSTRSLADPLSVTYVATQISGDEWQYDYTLSGPFAVGDDLAVYFPLATSSALNDLQTGGSDWTTFAFQPDPALPADGEFDMLANVDNPSLAPTFSIQFIFSGTGSPGTQNFVLYDPDFNIVTSGVTQPAGELSPVPEPATFVLLGSGLAAMARARRRRI